MTHPRRLIALLLLATGVLLVLLGLIAALGGTPGGILASLAATTALLYAGAAWLRQPPVVASHPSRPVVVFDHDCCVVAGPATGQSLPMQYPEMLRPEIERRCRAALDGTTERFFCLQNGRSVTFDALPVRNADGAVVFGLLLASEAPPAQAPGATDDVRGTIVGCGPLAQW
jgi:hypothetical protein